MMVGKGSNIIDNVLLFVGGLFSSIVVFNFNEEIIS